jgi:type IV secretion system protein VirB5
MSMLRTPRLAHLPRLATLALAATLLTSIAPARAGGMPVIDAAAVAQLSQQLQHWVQQIELMQRELAQLQQTYAGMSGARGMESLLAGTPRNYLPPDWNELARVAGNTSTTYGALAAQVQAAMAGNAVLASGQLNAMTREQQQLVQDGRAAAALVQVLSRSAYETTSARFAALQQLIDTLARSGDLKAVLDLQARVQSEQAMLQNEQTKLQTLFQAAQAEQWAREQRSREAAIQDVGSIHRLAPVRY